MKKLQSEVFQELSALDDLPVVTADELAKHNKKGDCWVMIDGIVYDVSKFAAFHPGGEGVLVRYSGRDATKDFKQVHGDAVLKTPRYQKLRVGRMDIESLEPKEQKKLLKAKVMEKWLPFSEPYWMDPRGTLKSPFYKEKHFNYQKKIRSFMETHIKPFAAQWDEDGKYPMDLHEKAYKAGIYGAEWPAEYGGTPPEGGWDMFMDLVHVMELGRGGTSGLFASWYFTKSIGLPCILHHGSKPLKDRVCRDVISGKKIIALAVTEPWGGSDVANVRCTAIDQGDHYLVNGEKKFITSGMTCHFFTTCVRTDPTKKGMEGLSVLCIDADLAGIDKKKIKTQGWWTGNTALITFDNVKVPKSCLVGKEGDGFRYIMENFNHERWSACVLGASGCMRLIGSAIKYARNRHTFGKPLIDNQIIRQKIANMAMKTEALFALVEQLTYHMEIKVNHVDMSARIAMCKVFSTQTLEFCARETSQIFGGNSYMRSGPGQDVERAYREVRVAAIGGGSEEILLDFVMRASKL